MSLERWGPNKVGLMTKMTNGYWVKADEAEAEIKSLQEINNGLSDECADFGPVLEENKRLQAELDDLKKELENVRNGN